MKLHRKRVLSIFLIASLSVSLNANAEKRLYSHWESFGSSGDPGGVTYTLVIDGWYDDGTGTSPQRFPNGGRRGSSISRMTKDKKIDGPKTPGKGCTVASNVPGYRGLPAGVRKWNFYIDPATPKVIQDAFRSNFELINQDQMLRSRTFRFAETTIEKAQLFISPPGSVGPSLRPGDVATTHIRENRDGSVRTTWTVVTNSPIDKALADTMAAHEIGHTTGVDDDQGTGPLPEVGPDSSYPTVMYWAVGDIKGLKMDPCTLSVIDANVNRGKN